MAKIPSDEIDRVETQEWMYSLDYVLRQRGRERAVTLLSQLQRRAAEYGLQLPYAVKTPYASAKK